MLRDGVPRRSLEPVGEGEVEPGAGRLRDRFVRGVADEEVPEAVAVAAGAGAALRDHEVLARKRAEQPRERVARRLGQERLERAGGERLAPRPTPPPGPSARPPGGGRVARRAARTRSAGCGGPRDRPPRPRRRRRGPAGPRRPASAAPPRGTAGCRRRPRSPGRARRRAGPRRRGARPRGHRRRRARAARDGRRRLAGPAPQPGRASSSSGRAMHSRRSRASARSARCSTRSSRAGSAQWTSSSTRTTGRSRARASRRRRTAQAVCSALPEPGRPNRPPRPRRPPRRRAPRPQRPRGRLPDVVRPRELRQPEGRPQRLGEGQPRDALAVREAPATQHLRRVPQRSQELLDEPALAGPRDPEHGEQAAGTLLDDSAVCVGEQRGLPVAPDHRRVEPSGPSRRASSEREDAPGADGLRLPFGGERRRGLGSDRVPHQPPRRLAHEHLARLPRPTGAATRCSSRRR